MNWGQPNKFDSHGRPLVWPGGIIRYGKDGRARYVIEKRRGGVRYHISTRAESLNAALAHWERFQKDPDAYRPNGPVSEAPLLLTADLVHEYLAYCAKPHGDKPANTPEWRTKKRGVLEWWALQLVDDRDRMLDLRHVSLVDHILPALNGDSRRGIKPAKGLGHRVRVLKHLYAWLREERHLVEPSGDPTLGKLKAQKSGSAQRKGKKKVTTRESVEAVLALFDKKAQKPSTEGLDGRKRQGIRPRRAYKVFGDALTVQAGTGWHTTEVLRFAQDGEALDIPPGMKREYGSVGILVCPKHKSGDEHRTKVNARVLAAGSRLLANGGFSRKWYDTAVRDACDELKIPRFTPANMRHTNSTFAIDAIGEDPKRVSDFHGHSDQTSKAFYRTYATVPKIPTILDDPEPIQQPVSPEVAALQARVAELEQQLAARRGQVSDDPVRQLEAGDLLTGAKHLGGGP